MNGRPAETGAAQSRWRHTFISADFICACVAALAVGLGAGLSGSLRESGVTILLFEGALGVAVLAVVLAALAILVAFLGEEYVALLQGTPLGVDGAIRPYSTIARVSAFATGSGLAGAFVWSLSPWWVQASVLACSTGFMVWALVGTVQLVGITAWHGRMRARMLEIKQAAREAMKERDKRGAGTG